MRAKFERDPMAGSKKVTLKFIIGLLLICSVGVLLCTIVAYTWCSYVLLWCPVMLQWCLFCIFQPDASQSLGVGAGTRGAGVSRECNHTQGWERGEDHSYW